VSGYSGTVKKVDLSAPGDPISLPSLPFNVGPIAGAAGRLFVASTTGSNLGILQLDSGEFTPIVTAPAGIRALWSNGASLYVATGRVIQELDLATGTVTTIAGVNSSSGFADGVGPAARFDDPGVIWGDADNLYIADPGNATIRRMRISTGEGRVLAGSPAPPNTFHEFRDGIGADARFIGPGALWSDGASLYLTDASSVRSIALDTAEVKTIAGERTSGARDGIGTEAQFSNPTGIRGLNGILYIADSGNGVIRQMNIASKEVTTLAGTFGSRGATDGTFKDARFRVPRGMWANGRTLYVSDVNTIRAISLDAGPVRTVATIPNTGTVRSLWGRGDVLYEAAQTGIGSGPLHIYRIILSTGEVTEIIHGASDSQAGSPITFAGSGGIWGNESDLFVSGAAESTVYRLVRDSVPTLSKLEITNPGYSSRVTAGSPVAVTTGHSRITETSGKITPAGFAIFALRQNGVLISEASVQAVHAMRSGRIGASAGDVVNTGIAISNPNVEPAAITFYFTDPSGRDYGRGTFTLAGGTQIARFFTEQPFNATAPVDGTFTFVSPIPVSAVALRGYVNERSEFLMTTLPVVDLSRQASAPVTVPHIVTGGGWTTELVLVNPSDQPISGSLQLIGIPSTASSRSTYSVPARASQRIQFQGSADATAGAARILPQDGIAPSTISIFSFVQNGVRVTEASVPDVPVASSFRLYTEKASANGRPVIRSGVAIMNTAATSVDVTVEFTEANGMSARSTFLAASEPPAKRTIQIGPMSHIAMFEDEILGGLAEGSRLMRVSSTAAVISVIGIRGRYNERDDFLITTTPAIAEDAAADPRPLYIPHFVNGGGYTTQFVLFGATAQSIATTLSVTTEHFNQAGEPIILPTY